MHSFFSTINLKKKSDVNLINESKLFTFENRKKKITKLFMKSTVFKLISKWLPYV